MGAELGEGTGVARAFPDENGAAFITSSPALLAPGSLQCPATPCSETCCLAGSGRAVVRHCGSPARVRDESAGRRGRSGPKRGCE